MKIICRHSIPVEYMGSIFNLSYCSVLAASRNIRLQGGLNRCQGRLEELWPGQAYWRTACDETFGDEEAQVVCRQLGCQAEGAT